MKLMLRSFSLLLLVFMLISSCSDPKLENPFDPEGNYIQPMQDELAITELSDSKVKLEWQANPTIIDYYEIWRKTNDDKYEIRATVNKDSTSYIDCGLLTTNTYYYKLIGKNDEAETEPLEDSVSTSFVTIDSLRVEQQTLFTAKLTWLHECDYESGYIIERREITGKDNEKVTPKITTQNVNSDMLSTKRKTALSSEPIENNIKDFVQIADLPANNYEYTDENLTPNHTYEYKIHAYSELNVSPQVLASQEMTFPAPDSMNVEQNNVHTFTISWQDIGMGEQNYVLYRKIDDGEYSVVADDISTNTEHYVDDINTRNTFDTVYYKLQAEYEGESSDEAYASSQISFLPITELTYNKLDIHTIELNWQDPNEGTEGYIVEKKVSGSEWINLANITTTNYVDENAEVNGNLQYRVYAYSGENSTDFIETLIIDNTFPAPTDLQIVPNSITSCTLNWQEEIAGEEGFKIDRKKDEEEWIEGYQILAENTETFIETDLTPGSIYQYKVYAYYGEQVSSSLESQIEMTFPAPNNFAITQISLISCELTWDYSGISGEEGFKIERRLTGGSWIEIAQLDINTLHYEDTGLSEGETYEYMIYAYSSELPQGNAATESITMEIVCTDIDGNVYETIQIGDQIWMAENLKVTHYRNGDPIPNVTDNDEWANANNGAYCVYANNESNVDTYGYLYNWYAVGDERGLAPEGWHVPTDDEIKQLEMHLGMGQSEADDTGYRGTNQGSQLAGNAALWRDGALENDPEFGSSGFDFLPGGYRNYYGGNFGNLGNYGYFWSATEYSTAYAWRRNLFYDNTQVTRSYNSKQDGFSVRCVRSVE